MKKFLIEILIFSAILFLIIIGMKSLVPYYWGNKLIGQKIEYLKKSNLSYDTYFIGSSRTYRHIDPILFEKSTGIPAFNLGASGMFALETEFLLDKFLSNDASDKARNFYVQHINYMDISDKNLHSLRVNYFMDTKRFIRASDYYMTEKNYEQVYFHFISYVENQLAIGQISEIIDYKFQEHFPIAGIVAKQNGFYSLEQDLKMGNGLMLQKRHSDFLKSVKNNTNRKIIAQDLEIRKLNNDELGINNSHINLWEIVNNPLADPKYYFDRSHYNNDGSRKFTELISNIINKGQQIQ